MIYQAHLKEDGTIGLSASEDMVIKMRASTAIDIDEATYNMVSQNPEGYTWDSESTTIIPREA